MPDETKPFGYAVLPAWATEEDDPTEHWGRVGKQRIEDTGPLTKKRMETCDDEFVGASANSSICLTNWALPTRRLSCIRRTTVRT